MYQGGAHLGPLSAAGLDTVQRQCTSKQPWFKLGVKIVSAELDERKVTQV